MTPEEKIKAFPELYVLTQRLQLEIKDGYVSEQTRKDTEGQIKIILKNQKKP